VGTVLSLGGGPVGQEEEAVPLSVNSGLNDDSATESGREMM